MKIDRVILSSNFNPTYYHFWNPLSKVYKEKFGINPTLVWIGTKEEAKEAGMSNQYGDIIYTEADENHRIPWQTTWALFWATQFYPKDTCIIMGIDQVPLSRMFFDKVRDLYDTEYAMLIADAYLPHYWTSTASPSSYHVAKGETFMRIYDFKPTLKEEVNKVLESGAKGFWADNIDNWGIDESYSCAVLRNQRYSRVVCFNDFSQLCERRVECERHKETPYDIQKMLGGWYSECHMPRPFTNHVKYLTEMFDNIPICK